MQEMRYPENSRSLQSAQSVPDPMMVAAQALWVKLLDIPVSPGKLLRVEQSVSGSIDVWRAAASLPESIKGCFYWQDRHHLQTILGAGIACDLSSDDQSALPDMWHRIRHITSGTKAQFMGGLAFSNRSGQGEWRGFNALRFCLPLLEVRREAGRWSLSAQLYGKDSVDWRNKFDQLRQLLARLALPLKEIPEFNAERVDLRHLTDAHRWEEKVSAALHAIQEGKLAKVVLARATIHELVNPIKACQLASHWQPRMPHSYGFLVDFGNDNSFVGFSPERLLRVRGCEYATESLAGTQPRGESATEDAALESVLLNDKKLAHEHQLVTDYIASRLKGFSRHFVADAHVNVLKLPSVQHRQSGFRGQLNRDQNAVELLQALFPTPAVCGFPYHAAYNHIQNNEEFQRGWYSGAVGVVGAEQCEFSVAIRSALLNSNQITSFAGAGIVEGSDPVSEWCELNHKASIIESILNEQEHCH